MMTAFSSFCGSGPRPRRGGTFLEMTISCLLLALLVGFLAQTSVQFVRQQRIASARESAARTAANMLDRTLTLPFEDLTPERLAEVSEDEWSGAVQWDVDERQEDALTARRVQLTLTWQTQNTAYATRLAHWRFRPRSSEEAAP